MADTIYQNINVRLQHYVDMNPEHILNIPKSWLEAYNYAQSYAKVSMVPRYKMAAVLIRRDYINITSVNVAKTHPFQNKYNKLTTHTHAEIGAIIRAARDQGGTEHATIIVARHRTTNMAGPSFPCDSCLEAILAAKIGYIVCTERTGRLVCISTRDLD